MKKQLKYLMIGLGVLLFTSCKREYLDPIPQTFIADVSAFDTPGRIANQVNAMYAALKSGAFFGGRAQISGDIRGEEFINETTNLVTGADVWMQNPTGTSQNFVKNMWSQAYYVINLTNLFIDGMNAKGTTVVGTALGNNYIAEARLIRALSYYWLLQYYARPYADGSGNKPGLPLRLTGIKGSGSSDLARSTVAEVYAQILSDLNFAETNLPLNYSGSTASFLNTTRAHRNTAIALKTRVYLSMQNYASVITEANKIVPAAPPFVAPSGVPHALQADIVNVFRTPYTTTESILSMPMTATAGDNPGTQNQLGYYWAKSTGNGEYSLNPAGIIADPSFSATDRRRSFIATVSGKVYLNTKFNAPSPYTDYAPVIRYSEVLLNLAEALARTNAAVDARAVLLLNAVRQRSDPAFVWAPATQAALIDAILRERRIEFLGEGLRNVDLMRLLQTIPAKGSAPSKTPADQGYIWPISADEMSLNALMTDN
jgi:starch-binding outer membrane protein, SusD/RagB family